MTYRKIPTAFLAASLLLVPQVATPQSLGETARKLRKEREEHPPQNVPLYTNDNIPKTAETTTAPAPKTKPAPLGKSPASPAPKEPEKQKQSKIKTREYWQARFRVARSVLTRAEEEQQLAENQLSLLQIQQIRELNPKRSRELKQQVDEKEAELQARRKVTEKAQAALDKLKEEFKASGAPQDWIGKSGSH